MKLNYVVNEDLAGATYFQLNSLFGLDQHDGSLLEYARAFNCSCEYWKNDILLKAVVVLYIEWIKSISITT
jgi:hypothetical protein